VDIPSHNDLFQKGRNEILIRNGDIRADQADRDGADVNILLHCGAAMSEEVVNEEVRGFNRLLVSQATGADLDRLAMDRYGLSRKAAAPAVGVVSFRRPTATYGGTVIPADTRVATADGTEFATVTAASLGVGALGPVAVDIQAVVAGAAGNATHQTINRVISTLADSSITALNEAYTDPGPPPVVITDARTTGGDEEETDDAFRQRIRKFYVEARRGTLQALEFGALSVPGVRQAVAAEVIDPSLSPARYAQVFVADKDGYASTPMLHAVELALEEYRAAGIKVDVLGGAPYFQSVQIELAFPTGVNQSQIAADVRWAIVNSINGLAPGEVLLASAIITAARSVNNVIVGRLLLPIGDVVPTSEQVIRTSYDRIETVVIVSPGNVFQNTDRVVGFGLVTSTTGTVVP
jgi:uncharacterized phage protein gp47/JayE